MDRGPRRFRGRGGGRDRGDDYGGSGRSGTRSTPYVNYDFDEKGSVASSYRTAHEVPSVSREVYSDKGRHGSERSYYNDGEEYGNEGRRGGNFQREGYDEQSRRVPPQRGGYDNRGPSRMRCGDEPVSVPKRDYSYQERRGFERSYYDEEEYGNEGRYGGNFQRGRYDDEEECGNEDRYGGNFQRGRYDDEEECGNEDRYGGNFQRGRYDDKEEYGNEDRYGGNFQRGRYDDEEECGNEDRYGGNFQRGRYDDEEEYGNEDRYGGNFQRGRYDDEDYGNEGRNFQRGRYDEQSRMGPPQRGGPPQMRRCERSYYDSDIPEEDNEYGYEGRRGNVEKGRYNIQSGRGAQIPGSDGPVYIKGRQSYPQCRAGEDVAGKRSYFHKEASVEDRASSNAGSTYGKYRADADVAGKYGHFHRDASIEDRGEFDTSRCGGGSGGLTRKDVALQKPYRGGRSCSRIGSVFSECQSWVAEVAESLSDVSSPRTGASVKSITKKEAPPPQITRRQIRGMVEQNFPPPNRIPEDEKRITKFDASVNYLRLQMQEGREIHEYGMKCSVPIENHKYWCNIIKSIEDVTGPVRIYNKNGSSLFLPEKLPFDKREFPVMVHNVEAVLTLTYRRVTPLTECFEIVRAIITHILREKKLVRIGLKADFDPNRAKVYDGLGIEIWPGFLTVVREYEGGVHLLFDTPHKVVRNETALDCMLNCGYDPNGRGCSKSDQQRIKAKLVSCNVVTNYLPKSYKITGIDFSQNPNCSFTLKDGRTVTYKEYFLQKYNYKVRDLKQPLLEHTEEKFINGKKTLGTIYLIPEMCLLTGIADDLKKDHRKMNMLTDVMWMKPQARQDALMKFTRDVNNDQKCMRYLNDWGVSLPPIGITIPGNILPMEKIGIGAVHNNEPNYVVSKKMADFTQEVTRSPFLFGVDIVHWNVFYSRQSASVVQEFLKEYLGLSRMFKVRIDKPKMVEVAKDGDIEEAVRKAAAQGKMELAVAVFFSARDDLYANFKRVCCVETPVPNQALLRSTLSRKKAFNMIVKKVALQVNCKLGGALWTVALPSDIMVIGIDAYHDRTHMSVYGVVASMNKSQSSYHSTAFFQRAGRELGECLAEATHTCLREWRTRNGSWPARIVVYRDGVGDGDFVPVYEMEVKMMLKAFAMTGSGDDDYEPKMTFVVIQKRVDARFYAKVGGGKYDNPPPGSVIDHTITRKGMYDFFLVSQVTMQGTVTPSHYVVLYDTSGWSAYHLQRFTYKMTHMYYNWTGTVRVPAACQYAHKLCYLMGQHVRRPAHPKMASRLFYL